VPRELLDDAGSLTEALANLARQYPEWESMVILDGKRRESRLSMSSLWSRARSVQAWLVANGFRPGEIALLTLPTGPEIVAAYFGVMLAGGAPGLVATPSNRLRDPGVYARRVGAILANAGASVLYCQEEVARQFRSEPELLAGASLATPADVRDTDDAPEPIIAAPDDLATVQYSSGSTGTPKGVLLGHQSMLNNIRAVRDGLRLTSADTSVNWIPLYHDMGLIDAFLLPLLSGSPSVLIPTFDFMREPVLWLWALHHYRGALSWSPNFAYTYCATRVPDRDLDGLDLSSWRIAINAAEPVLAPTLELFRKRFVDHRFRPEAMTPAWGLAENVTIATAHPVDEEPRTETIDRDALATEHVARETSSGGLPSVAIGRCLPHCEVEIRAPDGTAVPDRRVGEVFLRTNSLFRGYHCMPEETARVLQDGWLDTGDQGYLVDGNLFFIARHKDLIVVGGEKYAPHDLEIVINQVDGIRQGCAVCFGVLNEAIGTEEIAIVAETHVEGDEALAAMRRAVRDKLTDATGLSARHVLLVPPGGIEKTSSGKLARHATRARYADRLG
jgi:acyl-CoA synthetase (AMP-forming)/AMP-acid ligase II